MNRLLIQGHKVALYKHEDQVSVLEGLLDMQIKQLVLGGDAYLNLLSSIM